MTIKKVTIRKGWFWSAGYVYGWTRVDRTINPNAVGIDMEILRAHPTIRVKVNKDVFDLDCPQAIDFVKKYQSYKWIKNKCIGIVSRSILLPYEAPL